MVHVKTIEDIINNYLKNYHEDPVSKAKALASPKKMKKNASPAIKLDPSITLTAELVEQVETYAKLNCSQLIKIMQIDAKFVPKMCQALIRKLHRGTTKYKMAEVRYLIFTLIKELMQTPLHVFDSQKPGLVNKSKSRE